MSRIIVTGAAGFIGSHICERLLKNDHFVVGIDCLTDYYSKYIKKKNIKALKQNERFNFIERNILDLDSVKEEIEYIFHVAAQAGVRASWGKKFDIYIKNNILSTQHLLELSKNIKGLKKFIYSSSSSIYGDAETLPTSENTIPKPISPYGVSKLAGEHLCQLYSKNYGVHTVSLRYFTVFGPRQRPDMAFHIFIKAILEDKPIIVFGNGEQSRDFTYISDVVEANILAMESNSKETIYNIGGGNYATVNQVLEILKEFMKSDPQVKYEKKAKGDVKDTKADIKKAKRELGFVPKQDLTTGLKKEIEWVKQIYKY